MAAQGSSALLQIYVLLLLAHPLDPSTKPERSTGASAMVAEDFDLEEKDPALIWWASWTLLLVDVLLIGMATGWALGRRFQRRWGERNLQSPSRPAGPRHHPRRGCEAKLMQLLRENRDLMQLHLRYSPQRRRPTKTAAKEGTGRRLRTSPQL